MRSLHTTRLTLAAVGLAMVATAGCRTPRRNVRVGGDAATAKITLLGFETGAIKKEDLIYELSGCISALNGSYGAGDVVSFSAVGLKKGLTDCQIRVRSVGSLPGIRFFEGTEPNVLYWKKGITIYQSATGGLEAEVSMDKLFGPAEPPPAAGFTLKVPVKFAAPETEPAVTAELACTPEKIVIPFAGNPPVEAVFTIVLNASATPITCTEIVVKANGKKGYRGKIMDGPFTPEAGKEVALKQIALELLPTIDPPVDENGVRVETQQGECKAGEVFDVAKGECVPGT